MSRLTTTDRNQPQQPNQNQQIIQNIQQSVRSQSVQQPSSQQFLSLAQGGSYLIINNNSSSSTGSNVQSTSSNITAINPSSQQLPTSSTHPTSPIPKKRLKLDIADSSSSSGSTTEDLAALKKRIYEHKLQRIKNLKEK